MSIGTIILIILVIALLGGFSGIGGGPFYGTGYYGGGGLGLVIIILLNDDYTPREFVVKVLEAVFRMNESQAYRVMMTAHQRGACVIAVFTRDVAETKAKEGTDLGKSQGYPLFFTTEPEE